MTQRCGFTELRSRSFLKTSCLSPKHLNNSNENVASPESEESESVADHLGLLCWIQCTYLTKKKHALEGLSDVLTHTWKTFCSLHMICITCMSLTRAFARGASCTKGRTDITRRSAVENITPPSPETFLVFFV